MKDLDALIADLRHPLVDVTESEQALRDFIARQQAHAFHEGVNAVLDTVDVALDATDLPMNPYGDVEPCTCGYGGVHEPLNPRCARNQT